MGAADHTIAGFDERRAQGRETVKDIAGGTRTGDLGPYYEHGVLACLYGEVWNRPGLTRKERRWITLACVGASGAGHQLKSHVRGAIASGDISVEEMQEFVLQFAFYDGFPHGSALNTIVQEVIEELNAK